MQVTAVGGNDAGAEGAAQPDLAGIIRFAEQIGALPEAALAMPKQQLERQGFGAWLRAIRTARAEGRGIFAAGRGEGGDLIPARSEHEPPRGMRHLPPLHPRGDR